MKELATFSAEALHKAELKALMKLPAELALYDKEGERIIAVFILNRA